MQFGNVDITHTNNIYLIGLNRGCMAYDLNDY